jgi:hypothetical protein
VEGREPPVDLLGQDGPVSTTGRLAAVLAATLLAGACSSGAPSADRTPRSPGTPVTSAAPSSVAPTPVRPTPTPPPPPLHGCYRLTAGQLTQPTNASATVSCTGPHTAATIFVGRLDTVVDGHAVAVDSSVVQRQLATTCPRKLAGYVGGSGGTRALSRFNVVWYSPSLVQSDRGADWFRCDLILFAVADTLQQLPPTSRLRGVLDRPGALSTYGLCGTAAPGERGFSRVVCARPHSWRAVDTIRIGDGSRYPGETAARRAGNAQCRDLARARSGGSLKFRYGWEWPTAEQWARGQHFGYCWVPD